MDPLRQPQAQKIICETRPTSQVNGKAEYGAKVMLELSYRSNIYNLNSCHIITGPGY